ncbi:penicillin-binding transpeptidase domain-containing protein [Cellulomonas sp. PhB143]|uniref:penicillin-binding transpeptidase domain-containing protein n=1 Tax=Cellulomonas sp. PhB143 TaxID=2485186 RepID=UPI000F47F241|nr:penicillin-binding transpeptidase domain-containing protein [Cellulomonas sp. PhB143]ROS75270.1 cell division protein FtsI/penicillin-binding protein 2 [Cellulomonas sp. PhB143]
MAARPVGGARRAPRGARRRRTAWAVALAPVLGLGLTACTADDPAPEPVATALASGLASTDPDALDAVRFTDTDAGTVTTERDAVLAGLGDAPRTAKVGTVVVHDAEGDGPKTATATLDWTWDVSAAKPWTYSTVVDLELAEPGPDDGDGASDAAPRWEVAWDTDDLAPDLKAGDTLHRTRVAPPRADVVGQDGATIVTERKVAHLGIDKTHVDAAGQEQSARDLASGLGYDPDAFAAKVAAAGPKAFVELVTLREPEARDDFSAVEDVPGASSIPDEQPLAPTREFAAPVLGRAGDATAEVVDASHGAIEAGDVVGLSGIQAAYDDQLRGTPGVSVTAVGGKQLDGSAGTTREVFSTDPVPGTPLQTTLDVDDQEIAEQVLGEPDSPSAIVAIDVPTGDVLAAASAGSDGMSTATLGQYAPGSTFKVATTLGMLRAGLTPDTKVPCTKTLTVDGRTFQNVPGYPDSSIGDIPLSEAFAHSCNTAMISQAGTVDQQALHDAAADLGLGVVAPGLGVPAYFGDVPADSTGTTHAASMIGQGKVLASPLSMATLAASVAAGERVSPVLVRPDGDAAGAATPGASATPTPEATPAPSALTKDEAGTLHELMRGVVTDGSATDLQDLPGDLAAKTGTAEYGDGSKSHAWMIAIQDDLAVAAMVENGTSGSTTAGPLMHEFLQRVDAAS